MTARFREEEDDSWKEEIYEEEDDGQLQFDMDCDDFCWEEEDD